MRLLTVIGFLGCSALDPEAPPQTQLPSTDPTNPVGTPGCGQPATHGFGGEIVSVDFGAEASGVRSFTLALPENYDPDVPHRLVVGFSGTNWTGEQIRPYLNLEGKGQPEIFVYPDPLWRDFEGWGNLGGWQLGPNAAPADGNADLNYVEALLDWAEEHYCIDQDRVFVTGHSWGGDMAMVSACFLGDRFRAAVPVAANEPYWFDGPEPCVGETAVWVMFGQNDTHFTWQEFPGQFGQAGRDFWLEERGCDGVESAVDLGHGEAGECAVYPGCSSEVRYCEYEAAAQHQIPSYYAVATMEWFRSL